MTAGETIMLMQPTPSPLSAEEGASPAQAAPAAAIEFDDVSLAFAGESGTLLAIDRVTLAAARGEITSVVGPSGCGKTTLLRLAAGLLKPSSGRLLYNGRELRRLNTGVGFVTQDSNLFPWATTLANVEFPLAVRGVPTSSRRVKVAARTASILLAHEGTPQSGRARPCGQDGGRDPPRALIVAKPQ